MSTIVMGHPPLKRDPTLPHQPVINFTSGTGGISLSCNCQYSPAGGGCYVPIETRKRWEPPQLLHAYRCHVAEAGRAAA